MTDDSDDCMNTDPYTITIDDWDDMNTITIDTYADGGLDISQPFSINDTFLNNPPTISVGDTTLTEEKIKTMEALFEAIENLPDDNELKTMFDTVRMMRKLKNED